METIDSTNWDKIWQEQMELTSFKGDGVQFWNKMASRMGKYHTSEDKYVEEMLKRMALSPDSTVLDVGCGNGAMTIPLAERVRSVTALDLSPEMLRYLGNTTSAHGLTNVNIVNADFLTIDPARLGFFDVVLASRSLPMGDLRQALTRINQVSRHLCYLTWIASKRETDARLCEIIGVEYHPYPSYLIIANMLDTMGIQANIEIFVVANERKYTSLDEAVSGSLKNQQIDQQARDRFKAFFEERSSFKNNLWCYPSFERWALIWWEK